ncbi:hypothetical protein P43SY_009501 [Pythium insidiosum]|uniref:PX domain-containing protein n=1 Tax=Pythium insidiosum TaxID=114742 RepID=A0AAD5QAK5_PYTIN|nr:hypothetical protein P43SY_009501 [Pythium insidiosum]
MNDNTTRRQLRPQPLLPNNYSKRQQMLTTFKRIDWIEMQPSELREDRWHCYGIKVHWKLSHNHVPTLAPSHRQGDSSSGVVFRHFCEFLALRDDLCSIASGMHPLPTCQLCYQVTKHFDIGPHHIHRSLPFLHREDVVLARLEQELTGLVAMMLGEAKRDEDACKGQTILAERVMTFLLDHGREQHSEDDLRIPS